MDAEFWHDKWARNEIGFHRESVNPMLERHYAALGLNAGARVLVPLCGKTMDIGWLLERGHRVVAAELNESAVIALFEQLNLCPSVQPLGPLKHYTGENLEVYVGDIFELTAAEVGTVDVIYDRAALVALPPAMRARYTQHLVQLTGAAPQLLITFEYDQSVMNGPPFSVPPAEVESHYAAHYPALTWLVAEPIPGGLKGQCEATEHVSLLK